ncbi:GTPase LSG1-2-like [Papaver somniferum]|uniref:GTPase LSG1-2-like n=1 Tax=Papaver somniferum TaxID=3469 RepID=UPI000E704427|nr:GTPase LSG1-2-like [Papaver somniferum]
MGKNEKTSLGRALVKHHNQMVQQIKEKGRYYRKQENKVLESVTEVTDIDAIIEKAEEAERLYTHDNPTPKFLINLDTNANENNEMMTPEELREQQLKEEKLHAGSLQVPRRPPWYPGMEVDQLDFNEKQAFLIWRRKLASLEENEKLVLTPFEKNLDIWRQLWRVLERSDLLVMVVDARDPLFYRCPDLEAYAREIDEHKETMLLVNKADLLPLSVREKWAKYFQDNGILYLFWSAKAATAAVEGKPLIGFEEQENTSNSETKIYGREELLARLQAEAEAIAATRKKSTMKKSTISKGADQAAKHVVVGFVGYPNVGKSSTINALVGEKRTGVTSTPGKTKHFQTLIISEELMLCDCPGLVFPSFTSSRYEMIASGVLPIDRMTQHREAIQVVANRVPRHLIEKVYNITLPKPKVYEPQTRLPLASELLRAYCASRGYVGSSGLPDETKASRIILKDYLDGKLPHFELPPGFDAEADKETDVGPSSSLTDDDSDLSDDEDSPVVEGDLEHALKDLDSYEKENGLAAKKAGKQVRKKTATASYKQHRKPMRKKDRSWRVGNDEGDGMPVVRVIQKPANLGPIKA